MYLENGMLYGPAKRQRGRRGTSGLEMSQNSLRLSWTFEEVDERLQNIMKNISTMLMTPPRHAVRKET